MRWRGAQRERAGIVERRCGNTQHEGVRWLPYTDEHFYLKAPRCRWCRVCQRRYMRDRWKLLNPGPRRGALKKMAERRERESRCAGSMLQQLTTGWGAR